MEQVDNILKVVAIGESDVGKTSLMMRYTANRFSENTSNTIGVDHFTMIKYIDTYKVKISFWDTAGQERFRTMANAYYRNAHGIIVVYDVSDRESFTNLNYWLREAKKNSDDDVVVAILGNKSDLEKDEWQVSTDEAKALADKEGYIFGEVSAKLEDDNKVDSIFGEIIRKILNQNKKNPDFEQKQKEIIRFQKECVEYSKQSKEGYKKSGDGCC